MVFANSILLVLVVIVTNSIRTETYHRLKLKYYGSCSIIVIMMLL